MVVTRWRARPRRQPRFVVLVDGSRSMCPSVAPALDFAVALASVTARVEGFVFSTMLCRIAREMRRAAGGVRTPLPDVRDAWGGGTSIGPCLAEFIHRHGDRLLGAHTVLIIASDGLDLGAPDVLRDAMARLSRVTSGVIWLNPLVETAGYEPTAQGMRIARPYVSVFTWAADAAGLRNLTAAMRLRR